MKIRTYDETKLTESERTKVRKMVGDRYNVHWAVIRREDMPVLLAYMRIAAIPLNVLDLLIKAS